MYKEEIPDSILDIDSGKSIFLPCASSKQNDGNREADNDCCLLILLIGAKIPENTKMQKLA